MSQVVIAYRGMTEENAIPMGAINEKTAYGAVDMPLRATVNVKGTSGQVRSASPAVGPKGPITAVVRVGLGEYSITILDTPLDGAEGNPQRIAPIVTCTDSPFFANAFAADAQHVTVLTFDPTGAAADCGFTLAIAILDAP